MKKQANIPKAFTGFLIVSSLIWLLINLSKEYTTVVNYKVAYTELAQNKILQEAPINEIALQVKANGFKLLSANFSDRKIKVSTKKLHKKSASTFYLLTNTQKLSFQKQLASGLVLEDVLQDTIFLNLGSLQSKKIPVKPNLAITYALGYDVAEKIVIKPDSVLVSGPELQLAKVSSVTLERLSLEDVSENVQKKLSILLPANLEKVKVNKKEAEVSIVVDKFTEGTVEVPVQITNTVLGERINVYPKKVKVVFKVGLKNFHKIKASSFEVFCNYEETQKNGLTYLIPQLKETPKDVSSIRIVPNKIDFLIHK